MPLYRLLGRWSDKAKCMYHQVIEKMPKGYYVSPSVFERKKMQEDNRKN
jgi:hypothetical protein